MTASYYLAQRLQPGRNRSQYLRAALKSAQHDDAEEMEMSARSNLHAGMEVHGADGRQLGTIERVEGDTFFAAGQRLTLDAIERVEAGAVHLWGDRAVYDTTEDQPQAAQSEGKRLPNTDDPLYVNEHNVEQSLEERLPRDGQR